MNRLQWFRLIAIGMIITSVLGAGVTLGAQLLHAHAAANGPALTVDASAARHAISPDIYGMNSYGVDAAFAKEVHMPVQRWGGDATSRYNWQVDSSNAGFDWYFMGGNGQSNPTPGASADSFVDTNKNVGSKSLLTIPMLNYINKSSQWNCSYPVSAYGQQQSTNPYVHPNGDNCGNSLKQDNSQITDSNIGANNIPNSPDFQKTWLQHLLGKYGNAAQGGVNIYQLDNEPGGWGNTHRDIHPGPTGYDELLNLSTSYAAMIKATDPTAAVDGPGDFGYPAYIGAGKPGDDNKSHGVGMAEYYLQQMHAYEQQHGVRLLDYFDEHYYPSSNDACLANCPAGDAKTQAERLQATRSLWDPTYKDNSWIGQWYPPIQLIRQFHQWVNKDYPGTKIAITEYNFGGLESINGALTEADVLGIFGREGLDLATLWGPPKASDPGAYAFRMYRDYDGKGGQFGDIGVQASSADQGQLAVYGAQRASDGALTLMVVNKIGSDLSSNLALSNFASASSAQVYTYSSANLNAIVHQPDVAVNNSGFSTTYPANSITLVVLPKAGGSTAVPTPAATPSPTAAPKATVTPAPGSTPVVSGTPPTVPVPTHIAFNNEGVSNKDNHAAGNYDGANNSYSNQLLAEAGFSSGSTVKVNGINFQWPAVAKGQRDNWSASGQVLPLMKSGGTLAFLGSSTNGPSEGKVKITYTDGSSTTITLAFSDWTLSAGHVKIRADNSVAAKTEYRNTTRGTQAHASYVFFASFKLDPNKTVMSVTLPQKVSQGHLHVFAVNVG